MSTWLLRKSGSDSNGGTSASVRSTGTDGIVSTAGGTTKISSISATWGAGDVGHGIFASSSTILRLISAVQVSQSIATAVTASGLATFTSAALFNSTMLGCAVSGPGIAAGTYISAYTNSSSMTLSAAAGAGFGSGAATIGPLATTTGTTAFTSATGQTWNVGGSLLTWARTFVTASGGKNVIAAGDSIYVGAGTYAETVANTLSGSAVAPLSVIGDVDGAKTGDSGQVVLSAYTSGNTSVPSATVLLALAATTNLAFSFITFVAGTGGCVSSTAATAVANYTFTDCTINALTATGTRVFNFTTSTTGLAFGLLIDRCTIAATCAGQVVFITSATTASGAADFDLLSIVRNSLILQMGVSNGIALTATGTAAFSPGGYRVYDCTIVVPNGNAIIAATALHISTTVPMEVHNCVIIAGTGISAATAGQITGDHNVIYSGTPMLNYTFGTGDVSNSAGTGTYAAPLLELSQSVKWAGVLRQFLAPDGTTSPLVGAGSSTFTGNYPTVDWTNRNRPTVKPVAAVGYMEFHDSSIQDTVVYPSGQTSSAKMTGPGDTYIWVPVDATSTTIAIQLYQGSGYTGTTYASASIVANGELGVTGSTQTCTSTLSSWQTLTFGAITPTKAGWVLISVDSFDTSGTGTLNFGALTAT